MRDNSYDRTIERNYRQKWVFLIKEYEEVKAGRSEVFPTVGAFYRRHGTCSQTFRKYYNRYLASGSEDDLFPRRRGPKWRTRRMSPALDAEIAAQRDLGMNRHEIYAVLKERRPDPPSLSSIYRSLRRGGLNRLNQKMIEEKRRILKTRAGELGHADLHRLSRDMFLNPPKQDAHLVAIVCSCTRLAWAEVVLGKKSLAVMLRALKAINTLNARYGLRFEEMLTDNGAEFASRAKPAEHPFEAMLLELRVKHRYTRPYRPQTNGKVERFWRSLEGDLVEGATFDDLANFSDELLGYLIYYNEARPHQAIGGLTPKAFNQTLIKH